MEYGYGIKDPIAYAIDTMGYIRNLIGQDKRIDFCEVALQDYQSAQHRLHLTALRRDWRGRLGNWLVSLGNRIAQSGGK